MTALEQQAVKLAIQLASKHKRWRWKEAKAIIQEECPHLCHHGWGLACDAYTDQLILLSRSKRK